MKKTWKKLLAFVMTLAMTASCFSGFAAEVKAAETGEVEVIQTEDGITIGNEYISREFSTANGKVSTVNITNKRTDGDDTVFTPGAGSEEFIIKLANQPKTYGALDRANWTATTNSYNFATGASDGPASNLIDGNTASIWHTNYGGGVGPQNYAGGYYVLFDLGGSQNFWAFSYTPRQDNATNGDIKGYELYASTSEETLEADAEGWELISSGNFTYNAKNTIYVNFDAQQTATQLKFVPTSANNGLAFAGGAEFNLHKDVVVIDNSAAVTDKDFAASELTLADVEVTDTTDKAGKKVTFTFEPFTFDGTEFAITENIVMYDGDHYMRKFMEIEIPEESWKDMAIDYIDLESMKVNASDAQWTIPTNAGGIVQMDQFKANLGQPIYIQGMFFGCEFPETDTQIVNSTGYMRYYTGKTFDRFNKDNQLTTDGKYVTWQTVAGAARSTDNQVIQADFFEYIYDIATPSDFRIQYNSWFDNMMLISDETILKSFIEIDRELNKAETRPLDSYVVDDGWINYNDTSEVDPARAGTGLNTEGFWAFNSKFPEGLTPSSELVQKFGSNFGVWVGPRGGYNFYGHLANIIAKAGKGSAAGGSIDVADSTYHKNLTEMFVKWQKDYGVNYWKWDGFADAAQYNTFPATDAVPGYSNDHMVGGYNRMYHVTDLWEGWIDIFEAVRASEKADGINKLWLSLTCYVNPSPWFLQWANSVWIQCIHDQADAGSSSSKMDRQLTYRDACYYDFINNHQFQFPLANVYNHDPIYGVEGTGMNINTATDEQFKNYLYSQSARGTAFWELYYSDSIMTDGKYEVTSEFLAWAEENHRMLKNAKMFGGDPSTNVRLSSVTGGGTQDAYGFAGFDGNDGIITIRNSAQSAKTVTMTFDRTIGVPEDAGTLKYHIEHSHNLTEGTPATGEFTYGESYTFTLQPDEVRMFRVSKAGDTTAPKMVRTFADADTAITVKFDEKVTGKAIAVSNAKVAKIEQSPDCATYHITLAEAPADGTEVTVTPLNVKDLAGNPAKNAMSFVYNAGNVVATGAADAADSLSGSNGFTVAATVEEATAGSVVAQGSEYALGINEAGKATFTLNGATAVSDDAVAAGDTIVGVKENNGILKLYVNGTLAGSAYNKDNRYYVVEQADITVANASAAKVADIAYGYDTVEDVFEGVEEEVLPNVKLTGLTATASATGEGSASNIFDGDPTTFWASSSVSAIAAGNPNVVVDLGGTYTINQVDYSPRFYNGAANYWHCTGNIKKLVLEVSTDGTTWTAVTPEGGLDISNKIVNTNDKSLFPHAVTFAPVEAKYVRISGTESYHWQASSVNTVATVGDVAVYKVGEAEVVEPEAANLALGKTVAARYTSDNSNSGTNGQRPLSMAVDGTKNTNNYGEFGKDNERASQYMQVDLGAVCEIEKVNLYRYWSDGRTYGDTVVAIADSEGDFAAGNATIIYNADDANVHGLGAGTDADYAESSSGNSWNAPEGTTGRYVRVYTYGVKNGGTTNHIVELEVYGFESEEPEVNVDLTALIERLVALNAIDKSLYTEESVAAFEAAIEPAYELFETAADQAAIDAMVESLANVEDLLEEKPDPTPEVTPDPTPEVTPDPTPEVTPDPTPTPDPDDSEHGEGDACVDFKDVTHGAWYEEEVQFVYDAGLMSGNDGLFDPSGNVTRAQVVTTLYRLAGEPKVSDYSACDDLVDVEAGKWYTDAVCWAYHAGVTTGGTTTKMFNMNTAVTRQQIATFFFRYADYMGLDTEARGDISSMLNAGQVSSYAKDAVEWAVGTGLISGSETPGANGETLYDLKPKATATRAQLAAILQRFCEN